MELPPDLLAGEYRNARASLADLLDGLSADEEATHVPATPGWTVRNLVAHMAGFAIEPATGNLPTEPVQDWMEAVVAKHAETPVTALLSGWEEHAPMIESLFEPMYDTVSGLVHDTVCHEHDIRSALGRPGNRSGPTLRVAVEQCVNRFRSTLGETGVGGAVMLRAGAEEWACGEGPGALTLDLDDRTDGQYELYRLLSTRRTADQMRALPWQGDPEPFLAAIAVNDWPREPLPHDS